jgi:peroxiredoxin
MTIAVGQRIPSQTVRVLNEGGTEEISTDALFKGKVVMFAVPGAFTPTCTNQHLPGYVKHADDFKKKGVDAIVCLAVNDDRVLNAWAKQVGVNGKVRLLADGNADLTKAMGLDIDLRAGGLGTRSKRYAMIVENGVVKALQIEEAPRNCSISSAPEILSKL